MKLSLSIIAGALLLMPSTLLGATLLGASDTVLGIQITGGDTINVGTVGTDPDVNNWPMGESPTQAIDGDQGTKYLNFGRLNIGILVTPEVGSSIATSLNLLPVSYDWESDRDPSSVVLMGTTVTGSTTYSDYTQIFADAGPFTFDNRITGLTFNFSNTEAYTSYLIYFPTVLNGATANSMQIADIQLFGAVVPEPRVMSALAVGLTGLLLHCRRRKAS